MTAPARPAVDIPAIRYTTSGDKVGHLLPRTWPATRRKGRPAACGIWRQKWRPVERADDPSAYRPCPACSTAAGLDTAPRTPVQLAPRGLSGRPPELPPTPVAVNTAAARTLRRVHFRDHGLPTDGPDHALGRAFRGIRFN